MQTFQTVLFEHKGKKYEIRVTTDGATLYCRAFRDGKPANGYSYRVDIMTSHDLTMLRGMDALSEITAHAKEDVVQERWEKLLKLVRGKTKGK